MKRCIIFVLMAICLLTILMGCSAEPKKADNTTGGLVQKPDPTVNTTLQPSGQATPVQGDHVDHVGPEYIKKENLLKLSDTITSDGISYSIQKVECTQSFGSRKLENLKALCDWIKADKKGNLSGKNHYIFMTMKYTNTTDKEIEFNLNNGGIRMISSEMQVLQYGAEELVYLDKLWTKGRKDEMHHWKLGPKESVTREVGWYCEKVDDYVSEGGEYYSDYNRTYAPNLTWSLYYTPMYHCDEVENLFLDLGLEVGTK